jgi:hypothetical protein
MHLATSSEHQLQFPMVSHEAAGGQVRCTPFAAAAAGTAATALLPLHVCPSLHRSSGSACIPSL